MVNVKFVWIGCGLICVIIDRLVGKCDVYFDILKLSIVLMVYVMYVVEIMLWF